MKGEPQPAAQGVVPGKPALSLILCSRNDNYQGNALWRLQTGLNGTARAIHDLGLEDSVEILLTDWGSGKPLRESLCLTNQAERLLSIIEVPEPTATKYQRDAPFSEVHALNTAARRSRGEYIGRIDQDTILGHRFLETFFELYRGERSAGVPMERALMLSNHRCVPYRMASKCPSPWVIDRFIRWFGRILSLQTPLPDDLYYQSYVGIWMIHRDLWFEIGGYDESFIYINWMEVDMILRLDSRYTFLNLGRLIDHEIYHLNHIHPLAKWGAKGRRRKQNPMRDYDHRPEVVCPNSDDWGLASEALRVEAYATKPGEAEAAAELERHSRWGAFILLTIVCSVRALLDRAALALIAVAMAGPRLIVRLSPGLRESADGYREAVREQPLLQWPGLLLGHRRARRTESESLTPA